MLNRSLSGYSQVLSGLPRPSGLCQVVGDHFGLRSNCLGKLILKSSSDATVELASFAARERGVGRILNQSVLENVSSGSWPFTPNEDKFRSGKSRKRGLREGAGISATAASSR